MVGTIYQGGRDIGKWILMEIITFARKLKSRPFIVSSGFQAFWLSCFLLNTYSFSIYNSTLLLKWCQIRNDRWAKFLWPSQNIWNLIYWKFLVNYDTTEIFTCAWFHMANSFYWYVFSLIWLWLLKLVLIWVFGNKFGRLVPT